MLQCGSNAALSLDDNPPEMARRDTAGKGPGIVLRAQNGAIQLSASQASQKGYLEILEASGKEACVSLRASDLKALARALLKVAQTLEIEATSEEITQQ